MGDTIPPGVCNNTALRKATRSVTRFYDAHLARTGLRSTQYAILSLLANRGSATMAELAAALCMDRATMGHNLRPLERDGLLTIRIGQHDRRARDVALTAQGAALEKQGRAAWRTAQAGFEAAFGAQDAQAMRQLMARIVDLDLPV
ncbi:hypothetical protein BAU08_03465 [Bordetella bronchialis]|uniref:HTH marR-type domain-containing protein n=2 Tax=Bordetella bronchialis TaxID=463025 RepID=A0A193FSB0_9BORD|nr:hypothetical protein BAU08_03465 [Bordetella bronchialis]